MHVVSVGSGDDNEFNTIKTAAFNALKTAEENGIKSIAVPTLGTGIIGRLTGKQSAEAMMSALKEYRQEGGREIAMQFVIYSDPQAFADFSDTLKSESFNSANDMQTGKKKINIDSWNKGMARDARANKEHFGNAEGPKDNMYHPN